MREVGYADCEALVPSKLGGEVFLDSVYRAMLTFSLTCKGAGVLANMVWIHFMGEDKEPYPNGILECLLQSS